MKIGLIDVDGHSFPNLALMKLSAYHKARGDTVEWWWSDKVHYDVVYMSKVFSNAYSPDIPEPLNADRVIKVRRYNVKPLDKEISIKRKRKHCKSPIKERTNQNPACTVF